MPHRLLVVALAAHTLAGCGLFRETHENHRTDQAHAQLASGDQAPATASAAEAPGPAGAAGEQPEAAPQTGDANFDASSTPAAVAVTDKLDHAFRSFFYQGAAALTELFATPGAPTSSMLCFPSALAYQAEYRRVHAGAPETTLKDGTDKTADDVVLGGQDVRFIADFCKADLKKGMTIPQGVGCISRLFTASELKADIRVIGQDAQWSSFGMYPAGTKAELRSVTPGDLHELLKSDSSVIALVGAYVKEGDRMKRVKGHFISLTGYAHADGAPADEATIGLVDPSADYSRRAEGVKSDTFVMGPRPAALAGLLPEHAGFELRGFSLGVAGATIVVESVIAFH